MATFPSRSEEPDDLTPATLEVIKLARCNAIRFHAREVSVHHLLLGIVEQGDAISKHALKGAGIEVRDIRVHMERLFGPPSEGGEIDDALPLSSEVLDCLSFARSLLPPGSSVSESLTNYYRQVSPALLFITLLRLPRIKVFLTSLLPSLRTIYTLLRQGMMSVSPLGISASSADILRIEREINKELSPGWLLSTEDALTSTRSSLPRVSIVDQFQRSHLGSKARTWNIVRFSQGNVKRMLRCIVRPNPGGSFTDLVGFSSAKCQLQEVVDLLATPPEFRRDEQKTLHGVLLVGPADNDRTLLARAIAGEANVPLVTLSCGALVDMLTDLSTGTRTIEDLNLPIWEHNRLKQSDTTTAGQNLLRDFFKQARDEAPCLVLLDELDALLRLTPTEARKNFFKQLLLEMDALNKQPAPIVVATVSDAHELDHELFHTGRFERTVEMQKDEAEEQTAKDSESKGTDIDPWIAFEQRYTPGQVVEGVVVTRVTSFGLFVRVEEGIEGLVPRSMVGGGDITPEELSTRIHEDERVTVCIRAIDAQHHRLALSMDISASSAMLQSFMEKQQVAAASVRQRAAIPGRDKYILLVDSSPVERRVISVMLAQHGWAVQTAGDGIEALQTITLAKMAGYAPPAAVLLAIDMPHMDGYELIFTLRAQPQYKMLPLVVLASRAASKHRQRALALGADSYVVKPFQDDELLNILNTLVYGAAVPQSTRSFARPCPSCQHITDPAWRYCSFCGASLASVCPHCGAPRADVEGARFCFECGNAFE